jgi:hypothetical protein
MHKHLKKAFSSIIRFPKISSSSQKFNKLNIRTSNYTNKSKNEGFLTIATDDIGFATLLNKKVDRKIKVIKQLGYKPWEKGTKNNIYDKNDWISNKKIARILNNNLKLEKDALNSINVENLKKYFGDETANIFNTYYTAKNYKFKNELKKRYSPLDIKIESIISNTKNLCLNNCMLGILKNERKKIYNKENGYKEALENEDNLLSKDIKIFENYKEKEKMKLKQLEIELFKTINESGAFFEMMKQKTHEHRILLDDIKKTIKNIIKYKNYAAFAFKLFGVENKNLEKCEFGEDKIIGGSMNEIIIEQVIKQICSQSDELFDKNFDEITEELTVDPLKIYTVIKVKEKMILKLLSDKENINLDRVISLREYQKQINNYENKYNTYMNEYMIYLEEYESEMIKVKLIEPNQKTQEFYKYLVDLFYEIKKCLNKEEKLKKNNQDIYIYSDLVIPTLKELKNKELLINKLFEQMEFYEKTDKALFSKFVNQNKIYNKNIKFREERESLLLKDIERRNNIAKKINQIIITGKYKYNLPQSINRFKSMSKKHKNKIKKDII